MYFEIRKGLQEDMGGVFQLVQELAEFENAPDEVITTEEEYKRLYEDGLFELLVAEADGQIVGISLFYYTFSTWKGKMLYLEDFVVKKSFRKQGIGKALFDATIHEARKTNCALMKWQVLDWNEKAIQFYDKYDATFDKEWWNGKLFFR